MRKLIVVATLLYTAVAVTVAGYLSGWFQDPIPFMDAILFPFVIGVPVVLVLAVIAYWRYNEWLTLAFIVIAIASIAYAANVHHDRFGTWFPSRAPSEVETSGVAMLNVHGQTLHYRLELHNAGTASHREMLVVTRDGRDRVYRLPLFDDTHSGYVSPKLPSDWIVLRSTSSPDIVEAEAGRFLLAHKAFRVDLSTGTVKPIPAKTER